MASQPIYLPYVLPLFFANFGVLLLDSREILGIISDLFAIIGATWLVGAGGLGPMTGLFVVGGEDLRVTAGLSAITGTA